MKYTKEQKQFLDEFAKRLKIVDQHSLFLKAPDFQEKARRRILQLRELLKQNDKTVTIDVKRDDLSAEVIDVIIHCKNFVVSDISEFNRCIAGYDCFEIKKVKNNKIIIEITYSDMLKRL